MCKTVKLNRRRFSEGNAKIKMNDGSVVIAQFHRGVLNGFRREWDPEGRLINAGYRYREAQAEHCW